jgi:hypothetical protein
VSEPWHLGLMAAFDTESTGKFATTDRLVTACVSWVDGSGKAKPLKAKTPLSRGAGLKQGKPLGRSVGLAHAGKPAAPRPARRETGFPRRVKLAVRTRAGNGEIGEAACEACGLWLGGLGGQVQHIIGRGMGGCALAVINSAVNAALLCGTPFDGCHGLATAFNKAIGDRGFWLKRGADPRAESMTLHDDRIVWRSTDGSYLTIDPRKAAA